MKTTLRFWKTLPANVVMLGLVSFFTDVSSEMIYPLLPFFFTGLVPISAAAIYIGLMDGLGETLASLLKIYSGRLSDASGKRKPLAVLGYGISTLGRPLIALVTAGWHVIALRALDRVGKGIRTSPRDALIGDSIQPEDRGLAYSFHRMMDHSGAFLGPLLAALFLYLWLGQTFFWGKGATAAGPQEMQALRWLFLIAFLPGLICMFVLFRKVHDIGTAQHSKPCITTEQAPSFKKPLPKRFYLYLTTVTLFSLGNSSDLFLIFYAQTRFELGLGYAIALWTLLHVSKIVFSLPGGRLSDKLGRRVTIVAGWLVYILVYAFITLVPDLRMVAALIFLYGLYYGLTEGAERALVADYVESFQRGRAFGYYHGAIGLAALPASLLFGLFWARIGPRTAFLISAGLAATATTLLIIVLGKKPLANNNP
ncbi:MAG: MFS transporter [Desulfobacteraceae bacterium]|nr:MAG: MFS transporter [Desulfobacteraceae bacterium]